MRALSLSLAILACLALCLCLLIPGCQFPGATTPLGISDYNVSQPYTHDNLTVFVITGQDKLPGKNFLTLAEAMEQKKIVVHEKQVVGTLEIENVSNDEIWIQSGDIVKGGQQDRTFANDCIIPAKSGKVSMDAYCVESGRWNQRGGEDMAYFSTSNNNNNGSSLKMAIQSGGMKPSAREAQPEVWKQVELSQQKIASNAGAAKSDLSASSMQLTYEKAEVRQSTKAYLDAVEKVVADHPDAIGYAAAINGKVSTIDIYGNHTLFVKLWPKLIDATCVEALADMEKSKTYPAVTWGDVQATMQSAATAKETANKVVVDRTALRQLDSKDVVTFESYDKAGAGGGGASPAAPVHQAMIVKEPQPAPQKGKLQAPSNNNN